jgi:uncharacterized protein
MYTDEFLEIIDEFITNEKVLSMKDYIQHCNVNCFEHCLDVSHTSYKVAKKLNLDYKSVTRAAMVHDMFLYDWHQKENRHSGHAYNHAKIACKNAQVEFKLSDKEKDMIEKHMWPIPLKLPKSKEGMVLTFVDKYCTLKEEIIFIHKHLSNKKIVKYAVFAFNLLFVRI